MSDAFQPRLRLADRQIPLGDCSLDEAVPDDHPVRLVAEYVHALDLSEFLARIRVGPGIPGRNATDPRLLLMLWIYATLDGVGSAREIDRLGRESIIYRWILGGVTLNYHTISDFRDRHAEALERLMVTHVSALLHAGLVGMKCVAQDGMRTRAGAGSSSFHRAESIEACMHQVEEQIAALKRQAEEDAGAVSRRQQAARERHARERQERLRAARDVAKEQQTKREARDEAHPSEAEARKKKDPKATAARASTTDPECRKMKMADGGTRPAYNVQCCTDVESKIIVGIDVTNQGSDGGLLGPMLEQLEQDYHRVPERSLVDGGYASKADVKTAAERTVEVYAPLKDEQKQLDAGQDPYQPKPKDSEPMRAFRARMGTAEAKALYRKRAETAEWVNAGMRNRGLYQVRVRGLAAVRTMVVLQALVHNLMETHRRCREEQPDWKWTEILRAVGSRSR